MSDPRAQIDLERLPRHVGVIMDGNGRWAARRGLPRTDGHSAGEEAFVDTVEGALDIGLQWLTVYAFSTENWKRPDDEVDFLMSFNEALLRRRRDRMNGQGVRFRFIGRRTDPRVPQRLVDLVDETEEMTAGNAALHLTIALNYGGHAEVVDAVRRIARDVAAGTVEADKVDEEHIRRELYAPELPDLDLIVRTSGEMRISNFLLWQGAYAELLFTPVLWPDFRRADLWESVLEYQRRSRRFGGVE